jgi:dTDP-4-amino-4,6-dideoxygalactose transaminase
VDLVTQCDAIKEEIDQVFHELTASAQLHPGEPVTRFESEFGGFVETEYAVARSGAAGGADAVAADVR